LRADFDVLVFTPGAFISSGSFVGWTAQLVPFMALGGGVVIEGGATRVDFAGEISGGRRLSAVPGARR
jgi:hypothetical protein